MTQGALAQLIKALLQSCNTSGIDIGAATQWASAPTSIPAALRCTFCSKARSQLRWLLALFDDFFGISCSSLKFSDSRSAESVRSGKSPKQDHWVGLSKGPAQCHQCSSRKNSEPG
jgi:hypothetical protein